MQKLFINLYNSLHSQNGAFETKLVFVPLRQRVKAEKNARQRQSLLRKLQQRQWRVMKYLVKCFQVTPFSLLIKESFAVAMKAFAV